MTISGAAASVLRDHLHAGEGVKVLHGRSSRDAGEVRHEGELVVWIRKEDHVGSWSYRGAVVQRP
ncbi:MAG: hypothetical protein CMJ54_09360 [Planctomycetaceae bacterium]|nr:hypothetical protein [Planctomycetaceae bacterium]